MTLVFGILNDKLGLPADTLQNLHRLEGIAGDQARWLYVGSLGQRQGMNVVLTNHYYSRHPSPRIQCRCKDNMYKQTQRVTC